MADDFQRVSTKQALNSMLSTVLWSPNTKFPHTIEYCAGIGASKYRIIVQQLAALIPWGHEPPPSGIGGIALNALMP